MSKSPDAFRTISEVAEWLDTQAHVLRFWESKFTQVKPVKRAGGRRYYRPSDMMLLGGIKKLLHDDGMTIKGAQKLLREKGVKYVASLSQPVDGEEPEPIEEIIADIVHVDTP
jgi:DNA-binding transcriptional MerR regulator